MFLNFLNFDFNLKIFIFNLSAWLLNFKWLSRDRKKAEVQPGQNLPEEGCEQWNLSLKLKEHGKTI